MKASKIYFSALFIISVLNVSCNKNNKEIDYGVSITAPKMIGTSAELFSEDNITILRKSNSFNFLILNNSFSNSDSIYNLSFSPLGIMQSIYSINNESYIDVFNQRFDIIDTTLLFNNISVIRKLVTEIDSTIKIDNQIISEKTKETRISQKLQFPLIYDGILKSKRHRFNINEHEQKIIEYFTIKGSFGVCIDKAFNAVDISIGNANYSLLLIEPIQVDIKNFISNFSENDYKVIIDKLEKQIIKITFPNISDTSTYNLFLPNLSFDSSQKLNNLWISSEIKIIKPTPAELKMRESNIEKQLQASSKTENYIFNKPFIYIIRGQNSNSILAIGVFINR
ncbi:MAG: serpin family protein [Bacteroidales bacterium]|nr:hypothetical protein [Bacteroidales bacterium]